VNKQQQGLMLSLHDAVADIMIAAYLADDPDKQIIKMAKNHLRKKTIKGKRNKAAMKMILASKHPRQMMLVAHHNLVNIEEEQNEKTTLGQKNSTEDNNRTDGVRV
jgi:hypothetical protein